MIALAALALSAVGVVAQPPGTRCPAREELERAIVAHVPDEVVGWVVSYTVDSSADPPVENRLRLVLADGDGRVRLRRELTIADDGCAAAAEGVALILERFFAQVSWTAAVPLPELERLPEPPPPGRRWELQAGASGRREVTLAVGLALAARGEVARAWVAAGGLVLEPARVTEPVGSAAVALFSLPVRVSLRRSFGARAVTFEAGPAATLIGERGTPRPGLKGGPSYRLLGAAGLVGAARWAPSSLWAVVLEAGVDVTLFGASFVVDGFGDVLAPHRIQAFGMAGGRPRNFSVTDAGRVERRPALPAAAHRGRCGTMRMPLRVPIQLKLCLPRGSNLGEDSETVRSAAPLCADDSVIKRCVAGDDAAWRELHRALFPTAVAFLRQLGVRGPELDDVCQEVFVQVFRYLGRFEGRADLTTWLYKICISQAGRLRRRQKVVRALGALFGPREAAAAQASVDLPEGEMARRVCEAIAQLSPRHREAFVLYEIEGLSGEQIAGIVDCPVATVWSRLHYARQEFQRAVEAVGLDAATVLLPARRADARG